MSASRLAAFARHNAIALLALFVALVQTSGTLNAVDGSVDVLLP
jgi:hypothetical protein